MTKNRGEEPWHKSSNKLWSNTKIVEVIEEHPHAYAVWSISIAYAADKMTDGFIPRLIAQRFLGATKKDIAVLEERRLWERVEKGWQIHDYLEIQTPAARIQEVREQTKNRVQKFRSKQSDVTVNVTNDVTRYTTRDETPTVTSDDTRSVYKQEVRNKKQETTMKKKKESEEKKPSLKDFDWRTVLEAWKPSKQHFVLSNNQAGKGYAHIDVQELAEEFKLSVLGKSNRYHYTDFDAAFSSWILKRSKEKPRDVLSAKHLVPTDAQIENLITKVQNQCVDEGMDPPDYTQLRAISVRELAACDLDEDQAFLGVLSRMEVDSV